jgi:hypothetical protein
MTAAGRSRLLVLLASLLLGVTLCLAVGGPADAQTATTAPPVATTAPAVSTTVARAGDEGSTRTVNRIVAVFVALAVVLVGLAVWFWRATRPVPRHLDGLDLMGTRRWRQGGSAERSALLAPVHERRGEEGGAELDQPESEPLVADVGPGDDAADVADVAEEPTPRAS